MSQHMDIITKPRQTILTTLDALTIDQLNTIPAGFNNNIIWNLGHMIAAQCGIWYKRAGLSLPVMVSEEFFETYKPGTKPERFYTADDLNQIKELFFSTLTQFEADRKTDMFDNYPTWTTRYGAELHSVEDAAAFIPFHEGLHIGAIVALRKLV